MDIKLIIGALQMVGLRNWLAFGKHLFNAKLSVCHCEVRHLEMVAHKIHQSLEESSLLTRLALTN